MRVCGLAFCEIFFGSSSWSASSIWSITHFSQGPKWAEHRKKWWNTARAIEYLPKICFLNVYFSNNRIQLLTSLRSLFVPCSSLSFTGSCVCYHNKIDSLNKWFKYSDCWENHMQYETGSHVSISIPGNSLILPFPYSNAFWNLSKTSLILTMRMEREVCTSLGTLYPPTWSIISTPVFRQYLKGDLQ